MLTRSGYILAIYEDVYKIDLQIYEALSDGRTIIEGLDVPRNLKISDFLKGFIYEFRIKMFKGVLSSKLVELLKTTYNLEMNAIYRFELEDLQTYGCRIRHTNNHQVLVKTKMINYPSFNYLLFS